MHTVKLFSAMILSIFIPTSDVWKEYHLIHFLASIWSWHTLRIIAIYWHVLLPFKMFPFPAKFKNHFIYLLSVWFVLLF